MTDRPPTMPTPTSLAETHDSRPTVLLIAGPTASGKSALAAAVAEAWGGTVINADSMQVYRELSLITARPRGAELKAVPHRLYGVLSAAETCSVARWRALAVAEVEMALAAGRLPILTGGTGLYLRAFEQGLSAVPEVPAGIRAAARAALADLGREAFHARLAERDPAMGARLAPGDSQRLLRAWEVLAATGRSLADWQAAPGAPPPYRLAKLCLLPPRRGVYDACDARLGAMLAQGAIEEVAALLALKLDPALPAMKAVGVPEFGAYLAGEASLEAALARAQQATRRYAKRQMTWLRHQFIGNDPNVLVVETQYSESLRQDFFAKIRQNLLTDPG